MAAPHRSSGHCDDIKAEEEDEEEGEGEEEEEEEATTPGVKIMSSYDMGKLRRRRRTIRPSKNE